jgi:hypothetical protein
VAINIVADVNDVDRYQHSYDEPTAHTVYWSRGAPVAGVGRNVARAPRPHEISAVARRVSGGIRSALYAIQTVR